MNVKIEKLDNEGKGIGYLDKIIFVPKTLPLEEVKVNIIKENKNSYLGKLEEVVKPSKMRIKPVCPYFNTCGGCLFLNTHYEDSLKLKVDYLQKLFKRNKIEYPVFEIIKNDHPLYYRNKISLKIVNKKIGFYEKDSHNLVEINYCYIAKESINDFLKDLPLFKIINGDVMIRSNYNNELLIDFKSDDKIDLNEDLLIKHHVVGVSLNNKCVYGENHFIEIINNYLFEVSTNSFFQVNTYMASKLFKLIEDNITKDDLFLDLYCGVGTLTINASKGKKGYGVEINQEAIINALKNKKINKKDNIEFFLADLDKELKIDLKDIETIIVDPPRSGLNNNVLKLINKIKPNKLIYVSCNPLTLVRDLEKIDHYYLEKGYALDMFSYTEHVECVCVLKLR